MTALPVCKWSTLSSQEELCNTMLLVLLATATSKYILKSCCTFQVRLSCWCSTPNRHVSDLGLKLMALKLGGWTINAFTHLDSLPTLTPQGWNLKAWWMDGWMDERVLVNKSKSPPYMFKVDSFQFDFTILPFQGFWFFFSIELSKYSNVIKWFTTFHLSNGWVYVDALSVQVSTSHRSLAIAIKVKQPWFMPT
jgi:hypothetical protein